MPTELWIRDPYNFIPEVLDEGIDKFVLSKSHLMARHLDPVSFMRKHFMAAGIRPSFMTIGLEGMALYDLFSKVNEPKAFYPVWSFDDRIDTLVDLLINPVGQNEEICNDSRIDRSIRPVFGQDHRIALMNVPYQTTGLNKQLFVDVANLLREFSKECKVHVSGSYTFRVMFDQGFHSADYDPWSVTRSKISMPSGVLIAGNNPDEIRLYDSWITLMGMTPNQLVDEMRNRLRFNIRSVKWASRYYTSDIPMKRRYNPGIDDQKNPDLIAFKYEPKLTEPRVRTTFNNNPVSRVKYKELNQKLQLAGVPVSDGILCDGCVAQINCKVAREGSVCTVKGSEMGELAKMFGRRDASAIIDGLGKLLEKQADRLEDAMDGENQTGNLNPEVTKQMNALFANGTKLAKLIDPTLNGKGVEVNILNANGGAAAVASGDPRQMVAAVVRELENAGIPRNEITADMVKSMLTNLVSGSQQQAIEATVIEHEGKA